MRRRGVDGGRDAIKTRRSPSPYTFTILEYDEQISTSLLQTLHKSSPLGDGEVSDWLLFVVDRAPERGNSRDCSPGRISSPWQPHSDMATKTTPNSQPPSLHPNLHHLPLDTASKRLTVPPEEPCLASHALLIASLTPRAVDSGVESSATNIRPDEMREISPALHQSSQRMIVLLLPQITIRICPVSPQHRPAYGAMRQ